MVFEGETWQKNTISEIIFIRACCCLGIVIYHYLGRSHGNLKFLFNTANTSFGFMFVTSFFCISGIVLYYNYPKIHSIKSFYYKRWKSIFPSFYICYLYFFLRNTFRFNKIFFRGHWSYIFLTIFGLDGYFLYKIKSNYLVGEWFLGAIIIIYILYPLLLFLVTKNNIIINNIIICFFYYLMYKKNYFIIHKDRNLITCITSFYFGIEAIRFKNLYLKNKRILVIAFIVFLFLYLYKLNSFVLISQIQGFSLFILLFHIGGYIMSRKIKLFFIEISNLSFSIFLFQHIIIIDILYLKNPEEWYKHMLLLLLTIIFIIICSKVHLIVVNSFLKSYIFKILDSFFIS